MPESNREGLPRLLFISPTDPDTQGNGLAMRAGLFLEALAQRYRVTLLVVPLFPNPSRSSQALIARCCEEVIVSESAGGGGLIQRVRGRRDPGPARMRHAARFAAGSARAVAGRRFDVIHAFRLYMAPIALAIAQQSGPDARPELWLDLDDIESQTGQRMADLYRWNIDHARYAFELEEARRYEEAEARLLPAFDRVYVCSEADGRQVSAVAGGEVVVAPNAVTLPESPPQPLTTHPFTFLFVGNLGYFPNEDAVRFFCRRVWPMVRAATEREALVRIVGSGAPPGLSEVRRLEGVRLIGRVADVGPEYGDADAVIVPIRGGGGTRIKVLEAFAHGRPVVSTPMGIEGIEATPETHYLAGDTAETFAAQCVRLLEDRDLGARLAERARCLVAERYSREQVMRVIAG